MKKSLLILLLGLLPAVVCEAQFAKPLPRRSAELRDAHPFSVGLTGSYAANDMYYTALSQSRLVPYHAPAFGLAVEWNAMNGFAMGFDAAYALRGTCEAFATEFQTSFTSVAVSRVDYALSVRGVELRIPLSYYLGDGGVVRPYVYVAPRFDLWLGGALRWERSYDDEAYPPVVYEKELDAASLSPYDLGLVAGLGLCGRVAVGHSWFFLKFDLSYGMSVLSDFSEREVGGDVVFQGWGDIGHEVLGERYLRDVEARLTLLVPLRKPLKDACSFEQKMRKGK